MEFSVRPYSQIAAIPKGTGMGKEASAVTLTDSAGNALKCNWIKVEPLSGVELGAYSVFLSSIDDVTIPLNNVSGAGSAMPGQIGTLGLNRSNSLEFFLSDSDAVSEIQIGVSGAAGLPAGVTPFILTYGYRMPINPLRAAAAIRGS
jgi:hypothetical protein